MELNEYIAAVYMIDIDEFSEYDLDMIDLTVRSVIIQMGWQNKIAIVKDYYEYS